MLAAGVRDPCGDAAEPEVDNRRGEQGQHLADQQTANDGDAQRFTEFRTHAAPEGQRNRAQQGRHGGHHDGAEAQQASLIDGFFRVFPLLPLGFERKIDHHDGIFLHDADQKNNADERNHIQILL